MNGSNKLLSHSGDNFFIKAEIKQNWKTGNNNIKKDVALTEHENIKNALLKNIIKKT